MRARYLAGQFARPSGWVGRRLIGPWLDRVAGPSNRLALQALRPRSGERVLEVGFGGGDLLAALLGAGAEVAGVDVSVAMIRRAQVRFSVEIAAGRLRLFEAGIEHLPLASSSFDRAVSVASLYFWPDPAAALTELARVVRPGGRLALVFEPPEELAKWPGHRFGFRALSRSELEPMLRSAGFGSLSCIEGKGRKPDRFLCLSGERLGANG